MNITLSDTGQGIDEKTRERIFEPFFTTKTKDEGTGLGLATVYGIVKQHGGNIWLYSEPGKGATFKIYLPVGKDARSFAEASGPDASIELSGSETILLVEDNREVRTLADTILKRGGYNVICAANGEEALAVAREHEGPLHLLLTDVVMPGMSGKELQQRIGGIRPEMRVLFMSGYTDNVIAHRGILDEGVNFIEKPFTVMALLTKVRSVLDGK